MQGRPPKGVWAAAAEHIKVVVRPLPPFTHPPPKGGAGAANGATSKPSPAQCVVLANQGQAAAACEAVEQFCARMSIDTSERVLRLEQPAWIPDWIRRGESPPDIGGDAAEDEAAVPANGAAAQAEAKERLGSTSSLPHIAAAQAEVQERRGSTSSLPHMEELAVEDTIAAREAASASEAAASARAGPPRAADASAAGSRKKQKVHDAAARKRLRQQRGGGGRKLPEVVRSTPVATSRQHLGAAAHAAMLQRVVDFLGAPRSLSHPCDALTLLQAVPAAAAALLRQPLSWSREPCRLPEHAAHGVALYRLRRAKARRTTPRPRCCVCWHPGPGKDGTLRCAAAGVGS